MTNEEAINILKSKMDGSVDTSYEWAETVRLAIKALKQPVGKDINVPNTDCISRQEYENRIKPYDTEDSMDKTLYNFAHNILMCCPSAQSEIIRCKDCKYSVDEYEDGNCYCKRLSHELVWIGENWDFFCAAAKIEVEQ